MSDMLFPENMKKTLKKDNVNIREYERHPLILIEHHVHSIPIGVIEFKNHKPIRLVFNQDKRSISYYRGLQKGKFKLDPKYFKDDKGNITLTEISLVLNINKRIK